MKKVTQKAYSRRISDFEKAFDWSLPITVSNKKEDFKLWWVGLT